VPLAARGDRVTAVDLDPAMLDRARRRASDAGLDGSDRIEFVEADLVGLRLPEAGRYGLAFIGLNSLLILPSRRAQRAAFQTLAAHLAPGGVAAVDIWLPDAEDLARYDGRIMLEWPRVDPETGEVVTKVGSAQHDAATGTIVSTSIFEAAAPGGPVRRWVRRDEMRLVSAAELVSFAEDAGLAVELLAGDYGLGALGPGSERAVLIAVKE
jgi:SAM-dependent methyltransferase